MLQVAIIPRHFTVETAATFNQIAAHQESVVGIAKPVFSVGTILLSGRSGSVQRSRIILRVHRRCAERAAPLNSAYASLPEKPKNRFLFLHLSGLNISIGIALREKKKTKFRSIERAKVSLPRHPPTPSKRHIWSGMAGSVP